MYRTIVLFFLLIALAGKGFAQKSSTFIKADTTLRSKKQPKDTVVVKQVTGKSEVPKDSARLALERLPKTALRKALIFPGLGQIQNKQYWKLPFVYGGFVGVGLVFEFNQRYYSQALKELQHRRLNNNERVDPLFLNYDDGIVISYKDFYRRNRDLTIIAGVGFYALQAIDAYVKAKFARYDIDENLSFRFSPTLELPSAASAFAPVPALKITLSL